MGIRRQAKVAEVMSETEWLLRPRRFHRLQSLITKAPLPCPYSGRDIVLCKHSQDTFRPKFSSSTTWEHIRVKNPKTVWSQSWFAQAIITRNMDIDSSRQ